MFYLSRKKSACLMGIIMISGAAMAEEPSVEAAPDRAPVVTTTPAPEAPAPEVTAEKPSPAVTEVPVPAITLPDATATVTEPAIEPKKPALPEVNLDSEEQKRAYASGVMMAHYIEDQIAQQNALHITLSKEIMLEGITDTFRGEEKMNEKEVKETLAAFEDQLKILTQAQNDKNISAGKAFVEEFAKRPGVKKTSKGLYYLIEEKGEGVPIKDASQVEIAYRGELIDGTVIDGPKIENANEIFRVANMPPMMRDSVKLLRKGGRVKVVFPPAAVESTRETNKQNIVVIYTISVVNVNNP